MCAVDVVHGKRFKPSETAIANRTKYTWVSDQIIVGSHFPTLRVLLS